MLQILEHSPFSLAPKPTEISRLQARAAPGQKVLSSFSLRSAQDSAELRITASDLRGPGNPILASAVDVSIVKVWDQAGIGIYQSARRPVPELLLKDDREELADGYKKKSKGWRAGFRFANYYQPPEVRLTGQACTNLSAGQPKQILVSITLVEDMRPGSYSGELRLDGPTPGTSARLPLEVDVLPFTLAAPEQDLFLWYKGSLDRRRAQHWVSSETLERQLRDIFEAGFTSVSLNEYDTKLAIEAAAIAESVGFKRMLLFTAGFPPGMPKLRFKRANPVFYVSDELDIRDEESKALHIRNWKQIEGWGRPTMASLIGQASARQVFRQDGVDHRPDILSYYLPQNLDYFHAHAHIPHARRQPAYYYWHCYMEKPDLNRVLMGLYLWKSKATGVSPYCYQHLPQFPNSPFDDFDEWEPDYQVGEERQPFKDHMATYPAQGGSIATLQWKGLIEGIADLRYMTTLAVLIARARLTQSPSLDALIADIEARTGAFLAAIDLRSITITSDSTREPYDSITTADYDQFRECVIDSILELSQATGPSAPAHPFTDDPATP